MQLAILIVFGILVGISITLIAVMFVFLFKALTLTAERVKQAVAALEKAADVFQQSSGLSGEIISLVGVMRRAISSMESMNASIKAFTGIVLSNDQPQEPPPPSYTSGWRGGPPPPNPAYEEPAPRDEAGYMEQTDEDMAEVERQNELREQGIETDPLRIRMPTEEQINRSDV